ncbi:hypothetical protein CPB84DRAFT_1761779, partial [Gymnopilus junonius]
RLRPQSRGTLKLARSIVGYVAFLAFRLLTYTKFITPPGESEIETKDKPHSHCSSITAVGTPTDTRVRRLRQRHILPKRVFLGFHASYNPKRPENDSSHLPPLGAVYLLHPEIRHPNCLQS